MWADKDVGEAGGSKQSNIFTALSEVDVEGPAVAILCHDNIHNKHAVI